MSGRYKQNAVSISKSGESVSHSDPGLTKRPTSLPTAGRKPEACAVRSCSRTPRSGVGRQPKNGQGCGDSVPALSGCEAPATMLSSADLADFRELFLILDRWDREHADSKVQEM